MADISQMEVDIPASTLPQDGVILCAENITKVFPGTVALDGVCFNVRRGKVNALVGENGAGKSTLMKILVGAEEATAGRLLLDGKEIKIRSPLEAARHGIGIIYQEMNLFPNLSVSDNIFMAREIVRRGVVIDKKTQKQYTLDLIRRLGQQIDPDALVGDLRVGEQQIVEIAKALAQEVRILIMDEPTSALSTTEVAALFRVIQELKAHGVSIIYISHRLEEVLQIGDFITVLRDGRVVAEAPVASIGMPWVIEQMVGKKPAALFRRRERQVGDVLLRVEDLTLPRVGGGFAVDHVSFTLRKGEILGLYGLMGAGRSDLLDCLAGRRPEATGKIWLDGREIKSVSVSERIQDGIVLVPEDRQRDGLVQTMSVANNILLASLKKYLNRFYLVRKKEKDAAGKLIGDLAIRVTDPEQLITALSGGNQQKVIVARGLLTTPKVLLLDEPTRGIDVGAKSEMFEIMTRLASEGYGILFVSSELKEILAVADRVLVMSKGAITGEFTRAEATEEALVAASAVGHELAYRINGNGGRSSNGQN